MKRNYLPEEKDRIYTYNDDFITLMRFRNQIIDFSYITCFILAYVYKGDIKAKYLVWLGAFIILLAVTVFRIDRFIKKDNIFIKDGVIYFEEWIQLRFGDNLNFYEIIRIDEVIVNKKYITIYGNIRRTDSNIKTKVKKKLRLYNQFIDSEELIQYLKDNANIDLPERREIRKELRRRTSKSVIKGMNIKNKKQ